MPENLSVPLEGDRDFGVSPSNTLDQPGLDPGSTPNVPVCRPLLLDSNLLFKTSDL